MNAAAKLAIVPDDAAALLDLLAPGEPVTFQTFGEGDAKGARGLNRILHGTLARHRATLAGLNARGAGIFWMVNAGDGKGRKAPNVQRIRALFVDLDGAPLEPVTASPLAPHAIVESSPGRWHAYWRVPIARWRFFLPTKRRWPHASTRTPRFTTCRACYACRASRTARASRSRRIS